MTYKKDMEKYLITGASGQLGHALQLAFGGEAGNAMARPHEALDITDTEQVSKWLPLAKPDVVINCAAYTNVPQAEKDREQCWRVNALGVDNLARICSERDIPFFHISTDFVFGQDFARCAMAKLDPRKPILDPEAARRAQAAYTEDCPVGPVGYYAISKAAGEHAVLTRASQNPEFNYYIIRTAGLFEKPWRQANNFPFKIARKLLKGETAHVVRDVFTNICYVEHLVKAIKWMVEHRDEWSSEIGPVVAPGIHHIANRGQASWYEVATRIGYALGAPGRVEASSRRAYCDSIGMPESSAPSFTCLDLSKYHESFGPPMPEWTVAIDEWCKQAKSYFA